MRSTIPEISPSQVLHPVLIQLESRSLGVCGSGRPVISTTHASYLSRWSMSRQSWTPSITTYERAIWGWKYYFVLKLDSNGNTTTTPPFGRLRLSAAARANGHNSNDSLTIVSRALLADDLFRKRHRIVAVSWFTGWKMPIYVNSHRTLWQHLDGLLYADEPR